MHSTSMTNDYFVIDMTFRLRENWEWMLSYRALQRPDESRYIHLLCDRSAYWTLVLKLQVLIVNLRIL